MQPSASSKLEVRATLRPAPTSAHRARQFVAATLAGWGLVPLAETATLLVSELVTNSVLHARSPLEVVVTRRRRAVRVDVADASPLVPVVRGGSDVEMTGRGLTLVEALSARWGVEPRATGKSVWFELPVD